MPLPSTAIACATGDGLSIVIVTLPAFALSDFLSNLSCPLEWAATVRLDDPLAPPPFWAFLVPPPGVGAVFAGAGAGWALDELDLLLELPHPVTTSATRAAHRAAARTFVFMGGPPVVGCPWGST